MDDAYHGDPDDWREIRIPRGLSAEAVYGLLPTAPACENAGYLTKTRIRYAAGWDTGGRLLSSKPCTFHTHPTAHPHADLPSFKDLYTFVRYTHLRHVTAARSLIWVFDKTVETLAAVERLNRWEARRQIEAVARASGSTTTRGWRSRASASVCRRACGSIAGSGRLAWNSGSAFASLC